jgi:DNA primase
MARRGPVGDHHTRPEDNEQRLAALRIRLQETAREIRTAEDWNRCLRATARLPGESWANVLLIASRIPDATMVKGYEAWHAASRQVNRNEKGIEIFSTARRTEGKRRDPEDDEQSRSCREASRVAYVWDLSQITGQPLPAQTRTLTPSGEMPPGLWDCLCWLARREGFAVEREPGCPDDGTTLRAARRIRVPPGLSGGQAIWALAHQLGHVLLHDTTAAQPGVTTAGCQGARKAEADSVAFVTCARHGVQIEHGFSSPQTWAGSDPRAQPGAAILAAGERITTAAAKIGRYLDHHLPDSTTGPAAPVRAVALTTDAAAPSSVPEPDASIEGVLLDAEEFYIGQLAASWVPAYLRRRGITPAAAREWHIGYAPRGWTVLTDYLRSPETSS